MANYNEMNIDSVIRRANQMVELRDQVDVKNAHVKFSYDNRKTGALVPSVSLIPVADCGNCSVCARGCYDIRHVCYLKTSQMARANNSAILRDDPAKYWREIEQRVSSLRFFRFHIGGDIKDNDYLSHIVGIALRNPFCDFLVFTKMYGIVNDFIDAHGSLPKNLHIIFSDWRGAEMDNPHNLPVSSPLWPDGTRGEHCTDDTIMCHGNCSECAVFCGGCWGAKKGQTILFEAH